MRNWVKTFGILIALLVLWGTGSSSLATALAGDVDGDGSVTTVDATLLLRHIVGQDYLDAISATRADLDGDGQVTSSDASLLMRSIVGYSVRQMPKFEFRMIVTSDLKGAVSGGSGHNAADISNIAAYVAQQRKTDKELLLLDAGGSLYGSVATDNYLEFTDKTTHPMIRAFEYMHYDAVALGEEAFLYDVQQLRDGAAELTKHGTAVLSTNIVKRFPTVFESKYACWNVCQPYSVHDVVCNNGSTVRIGLLSLTTEPTKDRNINDEAYTVSFETAANLYLDVLQTEQECDLIVALLQSPIEDDAAVGTEESKTARWLVEQTQGIDLVLCGQGIGIGARTIRNRAGKEIPVISLADDATGLLDLSVSADLVNGTLALRAEYPDMSLREQDAELRKKLLPYASGATAVLDSRICSVSKEIAAAMKDSEEDSDLMQLLHRSQIWAAEQWISKNSLDVSPSVLSIGYPYIGNEGFSAGTLYYRDICAVSMEQPTYSLLLVKGSELSAWLEDYAKQVHESEVVYSLYGLHYLLNSYNDAAPLAYLEYEFGLSVSEDDVFTVIVAERGAAGDLLRPYLNEEWMSLQDRMLSDFVMPNPILHGYEEYAAADPLIAYLEQQETLVLSNERTWHIW